MRWGKLSEVKQCQAIMALVSRDCSEVAPRLAVRASNEALGVRCPRSQRELGIARAWGFGKLGNSPESTLSSCKPFCIGFTLEWMQILLSSLQLSLGEFLAGGLVQAARCRNAARAHAGSRQFTQGSSHRGVAVEWEGVRHAELEWVKTFREYLLIFFSFFCLFLFLFFLSLPFWFLGSVSFILWALTYWLSVTTSIFNNVACQVQIYLRDRKYFSFRSISAFSLVFLMFSSEERDLFEIFEVQFLDFHLLTWEYLFHITSDLWSL